MAAIGLQLFYQLFRLLLTEPFDLFFLQAQRPRGLGIAAMLGHQVVGQHLAAGVHQRPQFPFGKLRVVRGRSG
jgi:hypothetical protein